MHEASTPRTVITPGARSLRVIFDDLRGYRDLLYFLVWRDVKVRYKQTALGVMWAILQPLLAMVVFTLFFGRLAGISSNGIPYPVFSYAGLLPWTFFAQGLSQSSMSLVGSADLVRKVYFPRVFIPVSAVANGVVDLVIAMPVLFLLMATRGVGIESSVVLAPLFLLIAIASCLGIGLWISAINVRYRDFRYVVPFFVQLWLFVTPVIYPSSMVTERLVKSGLPEWLYGLNPMAGAVDGFRWAVVGGVQPSTTLIAVSAAVAIALLVSGWHFFHRLERSIADVV
jgi:lipopolysaccharide transport system permease protein